jgi:GcrA cell cycle regulator
MAHPTTWTPEQDAEMLRLVKSGHSFRQIEAMMKRGRPNITRSSIAGRVKRLKVDVSGTHVVASPEFWTAEMAQDARQMWDEGDSMSAIGRALGVSLGAVRRKRDRDGWPDRPPVAHGPKPLPKRRGFILQPMNRTPTVDVKPSKPPPVEPSPDMPTCCELESRMCKWPIGSVPVGHGERLRFCGGDRLDGRPYCADHCRQAYREAA